MKLALCLADCQYFKKFYTATELNGALNTMTKKNEEQPDIKLTWRLASKPSLDDVTTLLEKEVITKDEARQMLFSEVDRNGQIKALEEQVEFLKDIIDRLSKQPAQTVWHYVQAYAPQRQWNTVGYISPSVLCAAVGKLADSSTSQTLSNGTTLTTYNLSGGVGTLRLP